MAESDDTPNDLFPKPAKVTTELVLEKHEIGGLPIETVDARKLHAFLGVRSEFRNWIKNRIVDFSFDEGVDFVTSVEIYRGGERRDYHVSLDMAKELSMVERTAKGKEARRYFIECERRAKMSLPSAAHPRADLARECRLTLKQNLGLAKLIGLTGNQAAIYANRATMALTGVDTLLLMGASHIDAPQNEALLTPTDIGRKASIGSAQNVNRLLCELGLQHAGRDLKGHIYYEPTEAGREAGGIMQDTGKRHSTGTPVRQLRWASSIVARLQKIPIYEPAE